MASGQSFFLCQSHVLTAFVELLNVGTHLQNAVLKDEVVVVVSGVVVVKGSEEKTATTVWGVEHVILILNMLLPNQK